MNDTPLFTSGYPVFRGGIWLVGRVACAILGSVLLGMVFGALNGAGLSAGGANEVTFDEDFSISLAAGVCAFVGAITCPVLIMLAVSRSAFIGVLVVSSATGLAGLSLGFLDGVFELGGLSSLATVGVYLAGCIGWRIFKGTAAWIHVPGLCANCGYDLRGLTSGRCPECDTSRQPSVWADASL